MCIRDRWQGNSQNWETPKGTLSLIHIYLRQEIKAFIMSGKWFRLNPITQPRWARAIRIGNCSDQEYKEYTGKNLAEVAAEKGQHPLDTLMEIISRDPYACLLYTSRCV